MRRLTIHDLDLAHTILHDESLRGLLFDSTVKNPESISYAMLLSSPANYFLLPNDGTVVICLPVNGITYDMHFCSIKAYRGTTAIIAGKESILWMFANTPCLKVVAAVPTCFDFTYRFAKRVGLHDEGLSVKSYFYKDALYDRYLLGLEK